MKKLLLAAVALSVPGLAFAADVDVSITVPTVCTISAEDTLITVPASALAISPTTGRVTPSTASEEDFSADLNAVCNIASSVTMSAEPLVATSPTLNTQQFTNQLGYVARLQGAAETGNLVATAQPVPTSAAPVSSTPASYGRRIGTLNLSVSEFTSGQQAAVAGVHTGTITVTITPDTAPVPSA